MTSEGVYDVAIVGGGVIGCATAWALANAGASVLVIERDEVGAHASRAAAGMLAPITESGARGPLFEAGLSSLELLAGQTEQLRELSGVDPEWTRSGILRVARAGVGALRDVARAAAHLGCEWLGAAELRKRDPRLAPDLAGALWSPREGHVDALGLTRAYAGAAKRRGAQFRTGSEALGLLRTGDRVNGVRTSGGDVSAHDVVLCGGAWAAQMADWSGSPIPVAPVKGQMVSLEPSPPSPEAIVWGEGIYLVPRRDGALRVGATVEHEGFDARPTAEGVTSLLAGAVDLVPELARARFCEAWAGLRPGSADGLPIVGASPGARGLFLAGGHYRNGVLLSAITGQALADHLLSDAPLSGLEAFSPARFC